MTLYIEKKPLRVILFMPFGWFGVEYSAEELGFEEEEEDVSITALVVIELLAGKICGLSTKQTFLTGFSCIKMCSSFSKSEHTALTIALRDIALGLSCPWFCTFFMSLSTSSSLLVVGSTFQHVLTSFRPVTNHTYIYLHGIWLLLKQNKVL